MGAAVECRRSKRTDFNYVANKMPATVTHDLCVLYEYHTCSVSKIKHRKLGAHIVGWLSVCE